MKLFIYLFGPFTMIFIGLYIFSNVPLTFLLFYGWLLTGSIFLRKYLPKGSPRLSVISGVFSGVVLFAGIVGAVTMLHPVVLDAEDIRLLLDRWKFSGIGLVLVLLVINPILEEVYWRGVMHGYLLTRFKERIVVVLTAGFYTIYHLLSVLPFFEWPMNMVSVIPVFLAGLFWSYLRKKTGSLIAPILSHAMADAGILTVYWLYIV
ncbi:CPBP family intramembrane glutamic endopeptidase [Halobacillus mangrovi]|uniref:CPBP family intramembrane glutamic endopeptidase n=1 Tax=Halobacillus mangrovi TaxID=402384 RepID=UPI003D962396